MGHGTTSQAYGSLVIGRYNTLTGDSTAYNIWAPAFMVGNGTSNSSRANALVVYNSGIADVGSYLNLCKNTTDDRAIFVRDHEALWYNGTYFSWGFGGSYNYFVSPVTIGASAAAPSYMLTVQGATNSSGGYFSVSDVRWKKDMEPLENVLPDILMLNGLKFNWRADEFPQMNFEGSRQIGLIAQDVEKIYPELVKTDNNGYKAVNYEKLTVILLEGMKEQQKQIETQQQENQQMKSELQSLKEEMEQIKTMLAKGDTK
jgi:hypothetical protein